MTRELALVKFPHTPHLAWLGAGTPRDDKLLAPDDAARLLAGEVVVEEKIDGANVGISVGPDGRSRAQNRGGYIGRGAHPQFEPLWGWLASRGPALASALGEQRILFGEWCFARHSLRYDALPDWLLVFDVFDRPQQAFWSADRRNALARRLGLTPVPELARGRFSAGALVDLLQQTASRVGATPAEGVVVRREADGWLQRRAKLVRAEFVQAIGAHWSKRELEKNRLAR